jgi:hypothetical protein
MPRWRVDIIRKRAEHLGTVEAATEKEAIEKAAERFEIPRRWRVRGLMRYLAGYMTVSFCPACGCIQRSARGNERAGLISLGQLSVRQHRLYVAHERERSSRSGSRGNVTVNFDALHERARERGWTLTKSNVAARYGTMPIRFVLRDKHGLIHFRNLDEVERRLNAKAKQS